MPGESVHAALKSARSLIVNELDVTIDEGRASTVPAGEVPVAAVLRECLTLVDFEWHSTTPLTVDRLLTVFDQAPNLNATLEALTVPNIDDAAADDIARLFRFKHFVARHFTVICFGPEPPASTAADASQTKCPAPHLPFDHISVDAPPALPFPGRPVRSSTLETLSDAGALDIGEIQLHSGSPHSSTSPP